MPTQFLKQVWKNVNTPFWTPIGLMGWVAWIGGWNYSIEDNWGIFVFLNLVFLFAIFCWSFRKLNKNT